MTSRVNASGLVASDLDRTAAFYRAAGCDVPDPSQGEGHVVVELGDFRLMFDTEDIIRSFDPAWTASGSGRLTLAIECDSPAEVDRLHDELSRLGSGSHLSPFEAVWGQRYSTVLDPDGIRVDLYAARDI